MGQGALVDQRDSELHVTFRSAQPDEMDRIYLMGYDAWGDGKPVEEYLLECRGSPKYKRGAWFVLVERSALVASLIVYSFEDWDGLRVRGIGSVATDPPFRRMGYGHQIVHSATERLLEEQGASVVFLYSDIGSSFYADLGYGVLPVPHQKAPGSTLMAKLHPGCEDGILEKYKDRIPGYF